MIKVVTLVCIFAAFVLLCDDFVQMFLVKKSTCLD